MPENQHQIPTNAHSNCEFSRDHHQPNRRDTLKMLGLGMLSISIPGLARQAIAEPLDEGTFHRVIPMDKKLNLNWLKSLTDRGLPELYTGADLQRIGMPVGGFFCGTVYLSGDGRLWLWDIFNDNREGVSTKVIEYGGKKVPARDGANYVQPLRADEPQSVSQHFSIRVKSKDHSIEKTLDSQGFANVAFTGEYPIGVVKYVDPASPVSVRLEAFSPFIPLNLDDSSLPATFCAYSVKNESQGPVTVTLTGSMRNAVGISHANLSVVRVNTIDQSDQLTFLNLTADVKSIPPITYKPDVVLEDWSKANYEGWEVEGTSFGDGPIARNKMPDYQGDVSGDSDFIVNSHATAPGKSISEKDAATGKLTSKPFKIERNYIHFFIGGGKHQGTACVNLLVDGKVIQSITGPESNRMTRTSFDTRTLMGKDAVLQIVDDEKGAWGNIGVGKIIASDKPTIMIDPDKLPDYGSMGLGLLGTADIADAGGETGRIGRTVTIAPGASADFTFITTWHFPNVSLPAMNNHQRHYAAKFSDALAVAKYVSAQSTRLMRETRLWRDTWYDSTLPRWFLNRTMANTSTLATTTCHRLSDGRFWAWEGVGSCAGTCTHVWHYAQAPARLFPELERDHRERVDFGLAMTSDGTIRFRGENNNVYAVDGQAGRILGAYREHKMSKDDAFLKRIWPQIKRAMLKIIATDGDDDGLIYGPLHNTLDADWYGLVPWLVGMYHAALRASEEMAIEMSDHDFATRCRHIFETGQANLEKRCWRDPYAYSVQEPDPKAAKSIGVYDGCHIDQVLGDSWAMQVGLGHVMREEHVRKSLESLYTYNFTMDVGPFREVEKAGRWYAMPGDGGLIMVSFPFTPKDKIIGRDHWSFMYFNECMSGFEHQVASHMIGMGLITEGLAVTRAIHDRYSARLRNPYNEVECSDHYARAMASYGSYIAAQGFDYHGPHGMLSFDPKINPTDFRSAFTSAQGWGTYSQKISENTLTATIQIKWGMLSLKTFCLKLPAGQVVKQLTLNIGKQIYPAKFVITDTNKLSIQFTEPIVIHADGEGLCVVLEM